MDKIEKEFELELLPTGEVRFKRYDQGINEYIVYLLQGVNVSNIEDLQKFLESSVLITKIFGQEIYCG